MQYQAERIASGVARATVYLELAALRRMFQLPRRHGLVQTVPDFENPQPSNAREGFVESHELQAILAELPEDLRPLIRFLALTGWRVGEAKGLTWKSVDLAAGVVRLAAGDSKNGEARVLPFDVLPELAALFREQHAATRVLQARLGAVVPHVFSRAHGGPIKSLHAAWRAACGRAGLPGRLVHDLRRSRVREMERGGVSRSVAMRVTGHKTEAVYRRYAIVSEADMREGLAKLAKQGSASG